MYLTEIREKTCLNAVVVTSEDFFSHKTLYVQRKSVSLSLKGECEGLDKFLTFLYTQYIYREYMINKIAVQKAVEEWLEGKDYFLVDLDVSADDRISVEIDHAEGVWIEDRADLSRYIESQISREEEDYELEVGSAGLGQPFRVKRQYEIHIGHDVETQTLDGHKWRGQLKDVDETGFTIEAMEKVKEEGRKRPVNKLVDRHFNFDEVAFTKYLIKVK